MQTKQIKRIAIWSTVALILSVFLMAFGLFMFVFGGYDDSPGAQGLGLLMAVGGM